MDWSWVTWAISVIAVVASGLIAWREGNWTKRRGLAMGFVNHGGMWGDLVMLPMANAVIVPQLTAGAWIVPAVMAAALASLAVHRFWYHPPAGDATATSDAADDAERDATGSPRSRRRTRRRAASGDHMWPQHAHGTWFSDLSWSGWAHVAYVAGELTLLGGFVLHPMPSDVVLFVALIFTVHVPIGLLQPRWFRTAHIATVSEQPLLAPLLLVLWAIALVKM